MEHLGDITKISGYTAPIVDCVIGGSPCQDLSVAGKRAGLDGERSGLFMEQLRIIKEMRENDKRIGRAGVNIRPRYMVWENVPGAFSSNKGEDFRIVLEETAKVADQNAVIPQPPKGKWATSGCILGDGWSIAWRVFDAQFYGVPQRRRRIALVADFGGRSAPEILFIRKGLSGNTDESESKGQTITGDVKNGIGAYDCERVKAHPITFQGQAGAEASLCIGEDVSASLIAGKIVNVVHPAVPYTLKIRSGCEGGGRGGCNFAVNVMPTICSDSHGTPRAVCYSVENHPADSRVDIDESGKVQTLTSRMGTGGGNVPMVMECYSKSKRAQSATDFETWKQSDVSNTINTFDQGDTRATDVVVCLQGSMIGRSDKNGQQGNGVNEDISFTLNTIDRHGVAYIDTTHADDVIRVDDVVAPLQARDYKGGKLVQSNYIVRRLTPLECERLQGFPDGWTDIGEYIDSNGKKKQSSDAARYKALGNSIAIPPWKWVLKRLCACYERDATMASLFDGIGGFPYIWEQLNGKGSCLWASEIEEFPIAVTKVRFGGDSIG